MQLFVTCIIFLLLIIGIKIKIDLRVLLLGESLLCLLYLTAVGGSVMGGNTCGNAFLDCMVYIANYMSANIGGIVFMMLFVTAYIDVVSKMRATEVLAYLIKKTLGKIKNPYLMSLAVVFVGFLMRTCIALSPVHAALMCALFFPVLLACGCPFETSAVAMLIPMAVSWGPADTNSLSAMQIMGIETNMAEFFINVQIPIVLMMLVSLSTLFAISSKLFDKKHHTRKELSVDLSIKPDVPTVFAVMPLFPMTCMLVFSPFAIKSISLGIIPACLLSLLLTALIAAIAEKKLAKISEILKVFFVAFGDGLKNIGLLVLLATMFASCLNQIGGMKLIANAMVNLSVPPPLLVVFICILGAGITAIVGSLFGSLSIALPLAASMVNGTALDATVVCFLVVISCQTGGLTSPVNPVVLTVADRCRISAGELIKRAALPLWLSLIIVALLTTVLF